jgi:hypothetical protein
VGFKDAVKASPEAETYMYVGVEVSLGGRGLRYCEGSLTVHTCMFTGIEVCELLG